MAGRRGALRPGRIRWVLVVLGIATAALAVPVPAGATETSVEVAASRGGTVAVPAGMTGRPERACPNAGRPARAALDQNAPPVPAGRLAAGIAPGHANGLCRWDHTALLAVDVPSAPEGAVLSAAVLRFRVDSVAEPTELSVFGTVTEVPEGVQRTTTPPVVSSPASTVTAAVGTNEVDVLPAVEAMLAGEAAALAVSGAPARALINGAGGDAPPVVELSWTRLEPDTTSPTVTIDSPAFGEAVFGTVRVVASAQDDVRVAGVTATLGGRLVGTDDTAPYQIEVDTTVLPDGEYPLAVEAVDTAGNSDRELIPLIVDNSGGPLHRLDLDFEAGRIDVDSYVLQGLAAVLGRPNLSSRYAGGLPEDLSAWTWGVLQHLPELTADNRAKVERLLTPVDLSPTDARRTTAASLTAAASEEGDCSRLRGFLNLGFDCLVHVGEVTVYWDSEDYDVDRGTVPSQVAAAVTGFENAQQQLGAQGWRSVEGVEAFMAQGLIDNRAISLPVEVILLNRDDDDLAATAGHELVHQFQYEYLDVRRPQQAEDVMWWMEASAEWASHQFVAAQPEDYSEVDEEEYLRNIELFLNSPTRDLLEWDSGTNRQYGAFVFAEWLHENEGESAVRRVWEEFDASGSMRGAVQAVNPNAPAWLPWLWRDLYNLDIEIPGRVDRAVTDRWREELEPTLGDAPYETASGNRPVEETIRLGEGDSTVRPVELGPGAGTFLELDLDLDKTVLVTLRADPAEGAMELEALPLASYDLDPGASGDTCDVPTTSGGATVVEYDPTVCDGLSVIVANSSLQDDAAGSVDIQVGDRVDTTITNGVVRLGIHAEGHLNVPGYEASSGTGTSTVGLRYVPTNADSLSPGCECEGWGVADIGEDIGGWANESWGGVDALNVLLAGFDEDSGTSIVRAGLGGEFEVRHDFVPAPETPNLYRVDVTITNATTATGSLFGLYYGPLTPTYRRVMDWDVEPTAFREYVTIAARGGALPAEVVAATNDGFAAPDPRSPATDLGGVGLFTDLGPSDHGALFDVRLPQIDPGESVTFTTWYGAGGTTAEVRAALDAVGAEAWSLAEPDVPDGAQVGAPNTFAFGVRVDQPMIPAVATAERRAAREAAPQPRSNGVVRQ